MGVVGIDADACGHGQSEVLGALVGDHQDDTCLVQRLKQESGDEVADGESLGLDGAYQNDGKVVVWASGDSLAGRNESVGDLGSHGIAVGRGEAARHGVVVGRNAVDDGTLDRDD